MYFVPDRELGQGGRLRGMNGQDLLVSTADYARGIASAGGIPVLVPPVLDRESSIRLVSKLDGLLFAGGEDVSPIHYGQPARAGIGRRIPERDEFELGFLRIAFELEKPVLAICRGMQLVNVFFGGTLIQDLEGDRASVDHRGDSSQCKWAPVHRVNIVSESSLSRLLAGAGEALWVNSFHHQAVDRPGEGLEPAARSEDGIVEALENAQKRVLGIQWHPEMMFERFPEQLAVFKWLVSQAESPR